jgi:hypothetical protein
VREEEEEETGADQTLGRGMMKMSKASELLKVKMERIEVEEAEVEEGEEDTITTTITEVAEEAEEREGPEVVPIKRMVASIREEIDPPDTEEAAEVNEVEKAATSNHLPSSQLKHKNRLLRIMPQLIMNEVRLR